MSLIKSRRAKTLLLALLVFIVGLGIYLYSEYNRKAKDIASASPDFTITSEKIVEEFTKNDSLANKKYLDKIISINGNLNAIEKDENGFNTIVIADSVSSISVRCSMDSIYNSQANNLKIGTIINIKGICTGYKKDETGILGSDIILNRSCLHK